MWRVKEVHCVVNFIKGSALDSRLFDQVCSDMGAEHMYLLFQTEASWRSYQSFWTERQNSHFPPSACWSVHWWLASYILEGCGYLLKPTESEIGRPQPGDVFQNWKHVPAFQKSLKLWLARLRQPDPKPLGVSFTVTTQHKKNDLAHTDEWTSSCTPLGSRR